MGETKQNEKRCRFCEEFDWDMYACGYVLHHQKSRGEKHGDRLVYAFPCDKFRARAGLAPGALEQLEDITRHEHSILTLHYYPERTELYKAGLTDSEIAERLGLTTGCVASWRQKRRLPANAKQGPPRESFPERMELYKAGLTDREIADKLHLPIATVCSWRMSRDLPPNGFEEKKSNIEQRMELYLAGYTDIEIATALNLNRSTVCNWRLSHHLPPNVKGGNNAAENK